MKSCRIFITKHGRKNERLSIFYESAVFYCYFGRFYAFLRMVYTTLASGEMRLSIVS